MEISSYTNVRQIVSRHHKDGWFSVFGCVLFSQVVRGAVVGYLLQLPLPPILLWNFAHGRPLFLFFFVFVFLLFSLLDATTPNINAKQRWRGW